MPLITLDTSVALPAMLSPSGLPRKLLVVLAFGAVSYRAEHLRLERDLLIDIAESQGGQVHGLDAFGAVIDEAERRRARLAELLPFSTPDTYVAAGFAPLFNEHERKLREIGHGKSVSSCTSTTRRAIASGHRRAPASAAGKHEVGADVADNQTGAGGVAQAGAQREHGVVHRAVTQPVLVGSVLATEPVNEPTNTCSSRSPRRSSGAK